MKKIYIKSISVKKLFGYFNYELENPECKDIQDLIILYGDNGSGKTTILRLIFNLLSSKDKSGHKTEIANIKFEEVNIQLNNNAVISAVRKNSLIGGFEFKLYSEKKNVSVFLNAQEEDLINDSQYSIQLDDDSEENKLYTDILLYLQSIRLDIFYLSDIRKGYDTSSKIPTTANDKIKAYNNEILRQKLILDLSGSKVTKEEDKTTLAIKSLENWIQSKALKASDTGEKKTSEIYIEIINNIINAISDKKVDEISKRLQTLNKDILRLKTKSKEFSQFGLVTNTNYNQIEDLLINIESDKQDIVCNILEPYIRAQKAKLKELSDIQKLLDVFITNLNNYFNNKKMVFILRDGFSLKQEKTGEDIDFDHLSSGEKQLILLFCNVILASTNAAIFIIDEPELSLNIKWQRKLLDTLINLASHGHVQFIIATHSIELLTKHANNVVKLENRELQEDGNVR